MIRKSRGKRPVKRKREVIRMRYREFGKLGIEVSALGFGCMRFPTLDPKDPSSIDKKQAAAMLRRAIDNGVNYVDTAWPYHKGASEEFVGSVLKDGYRERVYLATKLPIWLVKEEEDFDRFLNAQLERLQTDHIDFYLLHALSRERWETVERFHLLDKLEKAKADGRIRYAGFSFHDDLDTFKKIVDAYEKWDFCQIQYNYVNTDYQAGTEGLEYAASRGLGVIIMEPLLGGKLANVTDQLKKALDPSKKPVEWAFDFLWNKPQVGLVLSGMSSAEQVEDNLALADRSCVGMLLPGEEEMLKKAKTVFETMALVPCTKCAYCMPCPFGLEIPKLMEAYNQTASQGVEKAGELYRTLEKRADACRSCRHCEKECPQHIRISEIMPKIAEIFG